MATDYQAFLARLQALAGENIAEFARSLGLKQSVVHRYVTGGMRPGYEFFRRLDHARVNLHWLLSGEGERYLPGTKSPASKLARDIENLDHKGLILVSELVSSYKKVSKRKKKR